MPGRHRTDLVRTNSTRPLLPPWSNFSNNIVPEEQPRLVDIVCAAAKGDVLGCRCTADAIWLHVVKLQERSLAAPPRRTFERAATTISAPHRTPHSRGDVARTLRRRPGRARPGCFAAAFALETFNQERERTIEDLDGVPRWHRVAQQGLRAAELVVRLARHRELNPVALGGDWRHPRRIDASRRRCIER